MAHNSNNVLFYAEYVDGVGLKHYAIHCYHPVSGIVDMMRDVKDDKFSYPKCDAETYQYEADTKHYRRFAVVSDCSAIGHSHEVWDTVKDHSIATFYDIADANAYCEQKNLDCKYLDDLDRT